ncbi:MAG: EutN/CcmL family microcompartment protein, partial [Bacteroidetes bacterium]|nr:EutN/CcmL family microcompartment protein [Bacteroidota bacterium]
MLLAKVTGNVVATQKDPTLVGHKLLLIRYLNLDGTPQG